MSALKETVVNAAKLHTEIQQHYPNVLPPMLVFYVASHGFQGPGLFHEKVCRRNLPLQLGQGAQGLRIVLFPPVRLDQEKEKEDLLNQHHKMQEVPGPRVGLAEG